MIERAFRVTGRVQGVGFRYFVARLGRATAVTGGVRNESDGTVLTRVSGADEEALARFREGLAKGPRGARVDSVDEVAEVAGPCDLEF